MILTTICIASFLICITWFILDRIFDWETDLAIIFSLLTGMWFLINTILLFASPAGTRSDIRKFEAVRQTVSEQRENKSMTEYERATLTQKIVSENEWLAGEQYWAKSDWLNWYYDKKILEVVPIK